MKLGSRKPKRRVIESKTNLRNRDEWIDKDSTWEERKVRWLM